jgi:serine/threonine-protein kinase
LLRVCPKCLTASNEDAYCPNDGERLVDPDELPPSRRVGSGEHGERVPDVPNHDDREKRSPPKIEPSPLAQTIPKTAGDPLVGQVVGGRYRVLRQLGEGGMGNVYRAVQDAIEKKVALKVLKAEYSSSPDMVVRFHREAVSACRIKHPNVVDVFDLGQLDDGRFYLAMELLEGRDLSQVLAASGPMTAERAVPIVLQICRALNAAHQSGIVHRDLKPENVFLHRTSDGDEIVKIVDFGIAHLLAQEPERSRTVPTLERAPDGSRKLTSVGMIFGTPEYMAPEQATGGRIDHRADIYAIGVILYKMLTGHAPFSGQSFLDVLAKQVGEEPPRMSKMNPALDIPKELEQVVMRSLAKKPDDRYATMARFAQAIAYAGQRARVQSSRRRWWVGSLAILIGLAGGWFWRFGRAGRDGAVLSPDASASAVRVAPTWSSTANAAPTPSALPASSPVFAASTPAATAPPPVVSTTPPDQAIPAASVSAGGPSSALALASASAPTPPKLARPTRAPARTEPSATGARSNTVASPPTSTSLPGIERCFETSAGVRREVPCN